MSQTLTQIGKYRIERELGRGGMGVVYKAFDPVVERTVAIKTIRLDVEKPEELVTRLKREAKSVGQLEHPNIVTLYDAGESEGLFYLAMQFIHGETLQDRIDRQRWFPLKEAVELFQQICAGLDYAHHHGVVHRDIKPANIMIGKDGTVKLTDFGIAKHTETVTSSSGMIVGTPSYMSPEQALGKTLDGRSDIFSLGSILYELTSGEKAFPGQNVTTVIYKIVHEAPTPITALQPGLDAGLEAIVLKALAKSPEQRFQTCAELARELELYLSNTGRSVIRTQVTTPPAAFAAAPPRPPPSVSRDSAGFTPTPSAPLPAPATPLPVATGTQAALPSSRGPLAWLVAGVLGTLLLMIVILLAVQLRRPTPATQPNSTTAASNPPSSSTTAPTTSAPTVSQPLKESPSQPAAQPPAAKSTEPPAAGAVSPPASIQSKPKPASPSRGVKAPAIPPQRGPVSRAAAPSETHQTASPQPPPPALAEPQTFEGWIVQGDQAFQQNRYAEALNAYSKAYLLNPRSPQARRKIAMTLTLLGRIDEARKYQ